MGRAEIRRLQAAMKKRGFDAYVAVHNTRYLAGTTAGKAVIVPLAGEPALICSRLEFSRAKAESGIKNIQALSGWKAPLNKGESVYVGELWQLVVKSLSEIDARVVGYDRLGAQTLRKIRNAHHAGYRELPELVLDLRMIKSGAELSLVRKSASIASKGMALAAELAEVGRTELEIAAEVEHGMRRAGSEGTSFPTIVASGKNSWFPHASATGKKLGKGELVVVDLGAIFNGYCSDMTRTFAISPTSKQLKIIEVVKQAQRAAIAEARPGVEASSLDGVARKVIARAGYARFATHGTGHGVGLEIHEPPSLAPNSKDVLRENVVFTVEPGVYVPRLGGARWEDMVLVKKRGHEILTR